MISAQRKAVRLMSCMLRYITRSYNLTYKKIKKEKFKEWQKMNLNNDPKCNAFLKKELNPISDKIKKIEDLIERASVEPEDIGIERVRVGRGLRGKNHGVMTGKRGGTYNERTSKNGTSYRQYF